MESIKENLNNQTWYNYNGKKIGSIYFEVKELPKESKLQEILIKLKNNLKETYSEMLVLVIFVIKSNQTYQYQIMNDCIKEIISEGTLTIEKDIMPLIETRYSSTINTKEKMKSIVDRLINNKKTIATMESCTGGQLASEITNISGASEILHESYVSYCNEAKIKFGVSADVIQKYTVYSAETAIAMATAVKKLAKSDIGIGITGQLGRIDPNNLGCTNNAVWYSISQNNKKCVYKLLILKDLTRDKMKNIVIREIIETLMLNN